MYREHQAMPFSPISYGPELIKLMAAALDAAWVGTSHPADHNDLQRQAMASRIMAAIDAGERDPEKLRLAALGHSN
jgi:hypothetical protein